MAEESAPEMTEQYQSKPQKEAYKQPRRLRILQRLYRAAYLGETHVNGRDNLDKLKPGVPVIFATTHITKEDVPATAAVVGEKFDTALVVLSGHKSSHDSAGTYLGMKFGGDENFLPVDSFVNRDGQWQLKPFNPDNFVPMIDALEHGRSIVIAAHNPVEDKDNTTLPDKAGYGAVYLAQKTGAQIVPVAVELIGEKPVKQFLGPVKAIFNKPGAHITFGEPYTPEPVELSETETSLSAIRKLQGQATNLMGRLAQMLPPEKRGKW
ncbi:hypothetical protein HY024_00685 [Candidatus Curtissbacteria bacterium]|nr:hypothetical protein [Candidatus Curtissbacteria bacterium]